MANNKYKHFNVRLKDGRTIENVTAPAHKLTESHFAKVAYRFAGVNKEEIDCVIGIN